MRPKLHSWRSLNTCARASSSCSTHNGSHPICNSLAGSKFREPIICVCCGEQSICRGGFGSFVGVSCRDQRVVGLVGTDSTLPAALHLKIGVHGVTRPTVDGPKGRGYRLIVRETDGYYGLKWLLGF